MKIIVRRKMSFLHEYRYQVNVIPDFDSRNPKPRWYDNVSAYSKKRIENHQKRPNCSIDSW